MHTASSNGTVLYDGTLNAGETNIVLNETVTTTTGTATVTVTSPAGVTGSADLAGYAFADVRGTIVANGSATKVSVSIPAQRSYSTFSGTAGQLVSLVVSNNTINGGGGYFHLLNPQGNEINFAGITGATAFIDSTKLATTGTYTVSIDHGYGSGGATLQLYPVPVNAGAITLNGPAVAISLPVPGENATRTLHGTAGQKVTVDYTGSNISGGEVDLLDPSSTEIGYSQLYNDPSGTFSVGVVTLPVTGTYTILVDPSYSNTGSLNLKLHT